MGMVIHVTRSNIDWAVERTGKTREAIIKALEISEAKDVVCTMNVPADRMGPQELAVFPRSPGAW